LKNIAPAFTVFALVSRMELREEHFPDRKRNIMKVTHRAVTMTLSAAVVGMLLVPAASACALTGPAAPSASLQLMQDSQDPRELVSSASLALELSNLASGKSPSIVGMWSFQFISMGNTTHNPPIADGTQLNWGYNQFHSDETEILNAGARSPAQQNFCLGVWQKTGDFTYQVNHFALNYNATTGALVGKIIVVEMITVSPGGTAFSGTFVESVFDTTGKQTDQLTGQVKAQRITVDTMTP
jgi:hypothetical protein